MALALTWLRNTSPGSVEFEISIHHHIAGKYLRRYAQESSWREDESPRLQS